MNLRRSIFAATKKQQLTSRNLSRPFYEERAAKLVELFIHAYLSHDPKEEKNIIAYESELKSLALAEVSTAINFYQGLFAYPPTNIRGNTPVLNYQAKCRLLLTSVKEIALKTNNAYLLFNMYSAIMNYDRPYALGLTEAFDCLKKASEMEGVYATKAAYCLARLASQKLLAEGQPGRDCLFPSLAMQADHILTAFRRAEIDIDYVLANLKVLADFGIVDAHRHLAYFYTNGAANALPDLSALMNNMPANPELAAYHEAENKKLEADPSCNKGQFLRYFELAYEKTMKSGPVELLDNRDYIVDFDDLIRLNIMIEHGELKIEEKNKYDQDILQRATQGEMGAMYLLRSRKENKEILDQLISMADKNSRLVADAASQFLTEPEESKKAARLGSISHMIKLGVQAFDSELSTAIHYFELAMFHAHLNPDYDDVRNDILRALVKNQLALDTEDKIEYYFKLCADMLKNMTNQNRFSALKRIMLPLKTCFAHDENQPEIVKKWLRIDTSNRSLLHGENYFPFASQKNIDAAVKEMVQILKDKLEVRARLTL